MKAIDLKKGDFFKLKNQRKYKRVNSVWKLGIDSNGKLTQNVLISYDNCKKLVVSDVTDCDILVLEKLNGYTEEYTNSFKRIAVKIGTFKTEISKSLKNGNTSMFHFCIKAPTDKWIDIDLRGLKNFPIKAYNYFECQNGLELFNDWIIINKFDSFAHLMTFTQEAF